MKKYQVIETKRGKALDPYSYDDNDGLFRLYIGRHPAGAVLEEDQIRTVFQWKPTFAKDWVTVRTPTFLDTLRRLDNHEIRIAYNDAKPRFEITFEVTVSKEFEQAIEFAKQNSDGYDGPRFNFQPASKGKINWLMVGIFAWMLIGSCYIGYWAYRLAAFLVCFFH